MVSASHDQWRLTGPGGIRLATGKLEKVVAEAVRRIQLGERTVMFIANGWTSAVLEVTREGDVVWVEDTALAPRHNLINEVVQTFQRWGVAVYRKQLQGGR